ncbi:hypothetical protein HK098_007471 [Nowakowskiella sp. JEL0407]|nr:hypothetical protein HK098_007471 [Nowakowskiella sp. JEL0407]
METYLRMTGTPYTTKNALPSSGPLNKVPYLGINGKLEPDSQLCIWKLQKMDIPGFKEIDANLTKRQIAIAEGIRVLLEETVNRHAVYDRWTVPKNSSATIQAMLFDVPQFLQSYVFHKSSKSITRLNWAQGFGRFSRDQQMEISKSAIDAVAELLGNQRYMFGDTPCYLDACVYGHLAHIVYSEEIWPDVPMAGYLKGKKNLVEYVERITEEYFPELVRV